MNYIVLDLEATDSKEREIIEIGAVKLNDDLKIIDTFQSFVKPTVNPKLSFFIKNLTSISQNEIDNAATFPIVFCEFLDWVNGDCFFIIWGSSDKHFFNNEFNIHNLDNSILKKFVNIQDVVSEIMLSEVSLSLKNTLSLLGYEYEGFQHRALNDAINTSRVFIKTIAELGDIETIRDNENLKEKRIKINAEARILSYEKKISYPRYKNYLEGLNIEELELKRDMLENLLWEEVKKTTEARYLYAIVWQKYKVVNNLLSFKKKEKSLQEMNLTFEDISDLLKCSNILYTYRTAFLKVETRFANEQFIRIKNEIEKLRKKVKKINDVQNFNVTYNEVTLSFERLKLIIQEVLSSPYFKEKYRTDLEMINKKSKDKSKELQIDNYCMNPM